MENNTNTKVPKSKQHTINANMKYIRICTCKECKKAFGKKAKQEVKA